MSMLVWYGHPQDTPRPGRCPYHPPPTCLLRGITRPILVRAPVVGVCLVSQRRNYYYYQIVRQLCSSDSTPQVRDRN